MRLKLTILLLTLLMTWINAQVVDKSEARNLALKIFDLALNQQGLKGSQPPAELQISDISGDPVIYIFSSSKGAFLILSADKRAYPILAFGGSGDEISDSVLKGGKGSWPNAFAEWIEGCTEEINYIRRHDPDPYPGTVLMWQKLSEGDFPFAGSSKDVAPLLLTKWNQTCGYNSLCPPDPKGPCGRVVTGCVATAMAQVIRYNEHPVNGTGSYCYNTSSYGELCADFSTAGYNYSAMSNTSGNSEVAKLMYHCGVSVSMSYGPSGSSAYSSAVANAMCKWFGYTNGLIVSKSSYSEANWERLIRNELEASRPVYYSGHGTAGHAFVLDGYKETNHFHVNWGWGGSYNGYFYLSSLNPGSMNFSSGQQGILGMVPASSFSGPDFNSALSLACRTKVTGNIADGSDCANYYRNTYPAALGKELIYKFTTTIPGRIKVNITGQTGSVYAFLLNHPDKDSLVAYGTNGVIAENMQPGTYYISVEGVAASEPVFTIEAVCPDGNPDLDIRSATVSPRFVESLQTGVRLASEVMNIGSSTAGACLMEYFISANNTYEQASDLSAGSASIPSLAPGMAVRIESVVTMPAGLTPGLYYIIFAADRANAVTETEEANYFTCPVTVPQTGLLDCSQAFALADGIMHRGNTAVPGQNRIEKYGEGQDMTGPEVIHTFMPLHNGVVNITFVDKSPGVLTAFVLPVCNENATETSLTIYNITDTVITGRFYGIANIRYYVVVDGRNGASGEYGIKADLPERCPEAEIEIWGRTDMCTGDRWPSFSAFWGYARCQWYRNGTAIPGALKPTFSPAATGDYHLEVTENGCKGYSQVIRVRMDSPPDTASIVSLGDTEFCHGGSAMLGLAQPVSASLNWALNGTILSGKTEPAIAAAVSGEYSLFTINGACRVESRNRIRVTAYPLPAGAGERLPMPSDRIVFHYTFTDEKGVLSGGSNSISGYGSEPADDRYGGFWQARYLPGNDVKISSSLWDSLPSKFSLGLWFKTNTSDGGVLCGFYDSPWNPLSFDALLYMSTDGKLHYRISNGAAPAELVTAKSYNDNAWHCVVIRYSGKMILEVDSAGERLESAVNVSKQAFKGYWSFGGPALPAGTGSLPPSVCWRGTVDDLIFLREDNRYLITYLSSDPVLTVISSPADICNSAAVSFDLPFTQKGISYRVWDQAAGRWYTAEGSGDGGLLRLEGSYEITADTEFRLMASNKLTVCGKVAAVVMKAVDVCTKVISGTDPGGLRVYPLPARDYVVFESSVALSEIRIYDSAGQLVHIESMPGEGRVSIDLSGRPGGVYFYRVKTGAGDILAGKLIIMPV